MKTFLLMALGLFLVPGLSKASTPTNAPSPQEVISRLMANASKKPPGPVENDVTDQTVQTATAMEKDPQLKDGKSVRESIAEDYNGFMLLGPLTSLYSDGLATIFYGDAKLTDDDLAEDRDDSDTPGFGDSGGFTMWIGPKTKNDAHVIATFCLVKQHGLWKLHAVYLSNDAIEDSDKDFIIRQLSAFAKKA